jgi:hypothetical protein
MFSGLSAGLDRSDIKGEEGQQMYMPWKKLPLVRCLMQTK